MVALTPRSKRQRPYTQQETRRTREEDEVRLAFLFFVDERDRCCAVDSVVRSGIAACTIILCDGRRREDGRTEGDGFETRDDARKGFRALKTS
jgi:hypothetical protein